MKRLLVVLALICAFTLSAQAQVASENAKPELSKSTLAVLDQLAMTATFVTLTPEYRAFWDAMIAPQGPNKLFDVRNNVGGASVLTYIAFKDAAAKDKVVDAFAREYGYQAQIPDPVNPGQTIANPQSKTQFFNQRLTQYLKEVVKADAIKQAATAATKTASDTADAELPQ